MVFGPSGSRYAVTTMDINKAQSLIDEFADQRYRAIYDVFWRHPHKNKAETLQEINAFGDFRQEHNQEVMITAATTCLAKCPSAIYSAMYSAITNLRCFGSIDRDQESMHNLSAKTCLSVGDLGLYADCFLGRAFDVARWLLPLELNMGDFKKSDIVRALRHLIERVSTATQRSEAANIVDDFLLYLGAQTGMEDSPQKLADTHEKVSLKYPRCPKNIVLATHERFFLIAVELTQELTHWQNGQLRERYLRKHGEAIDTAFAKSWLNKASRAPEGNRFLLRRGKRRNTDYAVAPGWIPKPEI